MRQMGWALAFVSLLFAPGVAGAQQCVGYSGPGGPCYAGPGGGAYTGPGGGAYTGPGGGAYTGPGGGCSSGQPPSDGSGYHDHWNRPNPNCR